MLRTLLQKKLSHGVDGKEIIYSPSLKKAVINTARETGKFNE